MRSRSAWWAPGIGLLAAVALHGSVLAQPRVSAEELSARLDRAIAIAARQDAEPSTARMEQIRKTIGLPAEVVLAEWTVLVPADPVLDALSGETAADFERAADRLRATQRALADAQGRRIPVREQVRDALDRAFAGLAQGNPSLVDRIRQAVTDTIGAILYRLVNLAGPGSFLGWGVLVGLVAAVVLLLRRARLVPDRFRPLTHGRRASIAPVDWARRAEEALRAGDLREAVRARYLALVATLAGGGLLVDAPALTAGEARAAVRHARPTIYPAIAQATESYERVVYGGAAPDRRDVQDLLEADARARTK